MHKTFACQKLIKAALSYSWLTEITKSKTTDREGIIVFLQTVS